MAVEHLGPDTKRVVTDFLMGLVWLLQSDGISEAEWIAWATAAWRLEAGMRRERGGDHG